MKLTYWDGIFAVHTQSRSDAALLKAAGARWHGPHDDPRWPASNCTACKRGLPFREWWYFEPGRESGVVRLAEYADDLASAEIERRSREPAEPPLRMFMTLIGGLYAVRTHSREEGQAARAAGARWHGPHDDPRWPASKCEACQAGVPLRDWWYFASRDEERAIQLKHIADEKALQRLGASIVLSVASRAEDLEKEAASEISIDVPAPPGLSYRGYQKTGIAFMHAAPGDGVLLADEPGLGKTVQVVGLMNLERPARTLIIAPASLLLVWVRETLRWLVEPANIFVLTDPKSIAGVDMGPHRLRAGKDLPKDVCEGPIVAIANYDRVTMPRNRDALMSCRWDMLVTDEAHYLKNPRSQRTSVLFGKESTSGELEAEGLKHRSDKLVVLTGTPMPNRPVELWPLLHSLAPDTFDDFFHFTKRYCAAHKVVINRRGDKRWDFTGSSNLDELQNIMRSTCMVRRRKADVLKELPRKVRQIIPLPPQEFEDFMGEDGGEEVSALMSEIEIARVEDPERVYDLESRLLGTFKVSFEEASSMRQALALAKVPYVLEIADDRLEEVHKILIFAHHHSVIEAVVSYYKKAGVGVVALYGPMSAAKRDEAVQSFQNDPSVRVFVGSIQAAGVGLTLTAASTVIFAEVDWVPGNMVQAEDRAHRIGQKDVVNVLHLAVPGTLDAKMIQYLVNKADVADQALDRPSTEIAIPDPVARQAERERDMVEKLERAKRARAEVVSRYPMSAKLVDLVQSAMAMLASLDEDRATRQNSRGFSKFDGSVGRELAMAIDPSPAFVWGVGVAFARKYRRQLGALSSQIAEEAERLREEAERLRRQ